MASASPRLASSTKPVDPFYRTSAWVQFSAAMKRLRNYTCERCGDDNRKTPWRLRTNHKVARKDGGADLDPSNAEVLCPACDALTRPAEHAARGRGG